MCSILNIVLHVLLVFVLCGSCHAGILCYTDDLGKPEYYTPDTESNTITVDLDIRNKTVFNGQERIGPWRNFEIHIIHYGESNPPREPSINHYNDIEIEDYVGNFHNIYLGFNGTHVCLGINHAQYHTGGSRTERCIRKCSPAFQPGAGFNQTEFFADEDESEMKRYQYINANVERNFGYQTSHTCYVTSEQSTKPGKPTYCPIPQKCVGSVVTMNNTGLIQYEFHASCQPQEVNCSTIEQCLDYVEAPYIGEGVFASVCNYCCGYDRCNDIRNCSSSDGTCRFYGPPVTEPPTTETPDGGQGDTSKSTRNSISLFSLILSIISIFIYYNSNV